MKVTLNGTHTWELEPWDFIPYFLNVGDFIELESGHVIAIPLNGWYRVIKDKNGKPGIHRESVDKSMTLFKTEDYVPPKPCPKCGK
jgi:hypothetical protein